MEKLKGFRRIFVLAAAMSLSFIALWFGKLDSAQFNSLWNWLLTAYLASDGAEKGFSAWRDRKPTEIAPPPADGPPEPESAATEEE